jgi:hypothetical protein
VTCGATCQTCSDTERDDDREEREAVELSRRPRARVANAAGEERPDDPREVELDRVERDGVRQVVLPDERRDRRLACMGPPNA